METNDDDVAPVAERRLRFVVSLRRDAPPVAVEITIEVGNREIIPVLVALPVAADDSPTLAELKDGLGIPGVDALITHLAVKDIHSLEDIRARGGLAELIDLPVSADDPAVQVLEAHANLNVLSDDVGLNQKLIDNGLNSVAGIAGRPRADFVSLVHKPPLSG